MHAGNRAADTKAALIYLQAYDLTFTLQATIPSIGIYIWSFNEDEKTHNTQYTIISGNVLDKLGNERSVCEWIYDAVVGDVQTIGLELLD